MCCFRFFLQDALKTQELEIVALEINQGSHEHDSRSSFWCMCVFVREMGNPMREPPPALKHKSILASPANMMVSQGLKDLWTKLAGGPQGSLETVERRVLPALRREGLRVPAQRRLRQMLQEGLEEPQSTPSRKGEVYEFYHLVNLLWLPIIRYLKSASEDEPSPDWTEDLERNRVVIGQLISKTFKIAGVEDLEETIAVDDWIVHVAKLLEEFVGVKVLEVHIRNVLKHLMPFNWEPTGINAVLFLRSSLIE